MEESSHSLISDTEPATAWTDWLKLHNNSGQPVSMPRFWSRISQTWNNCANHLTATTCPKRSHFISTYKGRGEIILHMQIIRFFRCKAEGSELHSAYCTPSNLNGPQFHNITSICYYYSHVLLWTRDYSSHALWHEWCAWLRIHSCKAAGLSKRAS